MRKMVLSRCVTVTLVWRWFWSTEKLNWVMKITTFLKSHFLQLPYTLILDKYCNISPRKWLRHRLEIICFDILTRWSHSYIKFLHETSNFSTAFGSSSCIRGRWSSLDSKSRDSSDNGVSFFVRIRALWFYLPITTHIQR